MNIIHFVDDYNFLYLDVDGNYREYYYDSWDGECSSSVYLEPGGPPRIKRKHYPRYFA